MPDSDEGKSLAGKVAIVTGAGRGIGRAEAIALAREGASVVVNNRTEALAHEVAAEIRAAGGQAVANADSVATLAAPPAHAVATIRTGPRCEQPSPG